MPNTNSSFALSLAVGSANPVKIAAVQAAISQISTRLLWTFAWKVTGYDVPSGVPAQPRDDAQTQTGAINRAQGALRYHPDILVGVGLEGGVTTVEQQLWNTVWVAVADRAGHVVTVNGSRFVLPTNIADGIVQGQEMGAVMDQLEQRHNVRQQEGMIGVVTGGAVSRQDEYQHLVESALGLWQKEWLYTIVRAKLGRGE